MLLAPPHTVNSKSYLSALMNIRSITVAFCSSGCASNIADHKLTLFCYIHREYGYASIGVYSQKLKKKIALLSLYYGC